MTKAELRLKMREMRNSLTREERLNYGEVIRRRLTGLEEWHRSNQLFTYLSFGSEVDTWGLVEDALSAMGTYDCPDMKALYPDKSQKKEIFVPRVEGKNMNFYPITETASLKRSKFGVPEPDESHQIPYTSGLRKSSGHREARDRSIDNGVDPPRLMLLPGLAFDLKGNRLGYGAGYYDRFLSAHGKDGFIKVALAYDFQIQESIAAEAYDIRVDYIVTPDRTIRCCTEPIE